VRTVPLYRIIKGSLFVDIELPTSLTIKTTNGQVFGTPALIAGILTQNFNLQSQVYFELGCSFQWPYYITGANMSYPPNLSGNLLSITSTQCVGVVSTDCFQVLRFSLIMTTPISTFSGAYSAIFTVGCRGVSGVYDPSECPLPSLSQQIGYNFTIISPVISGLISLSLELTATVTTYSDINRQHPQNAFMNGPIYFFVDLTSPLPLTSSSFISIGYRQFGTTELLTYLLNLNSQVTTLGLNVNLITSYPQSNGTTAVFSITYNGNRSIAFDQNSQLFDPLVYSVYNMELVIELDVSYSTVFSKKRKLKVDSRGMDTTETTYVKSSVILEPFPSITTPSSSSSSQTKPTNQNTNTNLPNTNNGNQGAGFTSGFTWIAACFGAILWTTGLSWL